MTTQVYDHISYNEEYDFDNSSFNYDEDPLELCEIDNVDHLYHHLSLYVYPIVIVLGLLGNLLVIVTYALYKKTKSMLDVYLLNVAVADLLFVLVLPFIIYNEQHNWVMGDGACKFLSGAYSLNLYGGVLLLACISIDHYLATFCANCSHTGVMSAVAWVMALLISLPTFIYSGLYQNISESNLSDFPFIGSVSDDYDREPPVTLSNSTMTIPALWDSLSEYNDQEYLEEYPSWEERPSEECELRFENSADHMNILIPSLQMAMGLLLPLIVMTFCYISKLLKAHNFHNHKPKEWVALMVLLVFIICHLPYSVTHLVHTITLRHEKECSSEIAMLVGLSITRTLAYTHCCLNPILYAFSGVCFRNHFRKFLTDIRCVGRDYMPAQRDVHEHDGFNTGNPTILTMGESPAME